jgi:hypothetical protein
MPRSKLDRTIKFVLIGVGIVFLIVGGIRQNATLIFVGIAEIAISFQVKNKDKIKANNTNGR